MTDIVVDRLNAALEGRYVIESELGEGGMATVYLADDLKHDRKVAVKVLKPELAAVVGAERFLAEIKVTANLQHPHILALHDSGEADSFLYYVMPYVRGETLRDRLDRERQLPVEEAVRIATAVGNALDHAHRHKVIHRDIKPGNILLQDGEPVVADFGIALAVGAGGGTRLTETGLSLGTPYYMSPEQATGDQAVGASTDTYALASVLYEMLVGDPPFRGSTAQAVLGKIIAGAPVSAMEQRPVVPANVDAALRRALEKLPADRFPSAQDFVAALGNEHFRYGEPVGAGAAGGSSAWNRLTTTFAGLAAGLALALGWTQFSPEPPDSVERYSLARDLGQVPTEWMSLSPDGSTMVMAYPDDSGQFRLWWRRWDDLNATPVTGAGRGAGTLIVDPIISPDGSEVAYVDGGRLHVAPLGGGVLRTLAESVNCCMRWGPDGFLYFSGDSREIHRVPVEGGAVEQVTSREDEGDGNHGYFQVLPGGEVAVFTVWAQPSRIEAMRMSTGERKQLTEGVRQYVTSTGHLVFGSLDGRILAAPFDPDAMELTGAPVPLVEGLGIRGTDAMFSLSESGDLLYWSTPSVGAESEFVWVTRNGGATPVDPGWTFDPGAGNRGWSLSPNGTRLAYRDMSDGEGEIWIKDLDDGPLSRFTFDPGSDWAPRWDPDGQNVTFLSDRGGENRDFWSKRADGTGEPTLWLDSERAMAAGFWSPDGEWLVFRAGAGASGSMDILGFRPGVDTVPVPLVATEAVEISPALSPDGRWLAYASNETGLYEVYVRPFPGVEAGQFQVSIGGAVAPMWTHSGRELFYLGFDQRINVAQIETAPRFRVVGRESLFDAAADYGGQVTTGWYDISADDQRLLMVRPYQGSNEDGVRAELILVRNWLEEVEERVGN